jgi:hypothetical protein
VLSYVHWFIPAIVIAAGYQSLTAHKRAFFERQLDVAFADDQRTGRAAAVLFGIFGRGAIICFAILYARQSFLLSSRAAASMQLVS